MNLLDQGVYFEWIKQVVSVEVSVSLNWKKFSQNLI